MSIEMGKNLLFTRLGEKKNEKNFDAFKKEVASLKGTMENASLLGLDTDEREAISAMLEKFEALKDFDSPLGDKTSLKGTYQLSSFVMLPALKALHESVTAFQEPATASDEVERLTLLIEKKKILREKLQNLSNATRNRLSFSTYVWWHIGMGIQTMAVALLPISVPLILLWTAVVTNPAIVLAIIGAATVVSVGVILGLGVYFSKKRNKIDAPSFHPLKESVDQLTAKITENIEKIENQCEQSKTARDEAILKAKEFEAYEAFLAPSNGDFTTSACYRELEKKRMQKLKMLQGDSSRASDELRQIEQARASSSALLNQDENKVKVKTLEMYLKADVQPEEKDQAIVSLMKKYERQTVALKVVQAKMGVLSEAFVKHNADDYLQNKYRKYAAATEPKSVNLPSRRDSARLFAWHSDRSKDLYKVASRKVNDVLMETVKSAEAERLFKK